MSLIGTKQTFCREPGIVQISRHVRFAPVPFGEIFSRKGFVPCQSTPVNL